MSESTFDHETQQFVSDLDEATLHHIAWARRVLRCAVLRTAPGSDVLAEDSHRRCQFDLWIKRNGAHFGQLDAVTIARLQERHQEMHDAARRICQRILEGGAGNEGDLEAFERSQSAIVADLALFKTECLERSAQLDALTGLPLRHGLEEKFQRCRAQALRHGEILVILMLDLDHFKRVNDEKGHGAGDQALRHVAASLRAQCRASEPVIRFGGEEFLALIQATDHQAAQRATERILQSLRDHPVVLPDGQRLDVRASAGIAEAGSTGSLAEAVGRADRALYAAKAAGRDTWRWAAAAR